MAIVREKLIEFLCDEKRYVTIKNKISIQLSIRTRNSSYLNKLSSIIIQAIFHIQMRKIIDTY